MVSTPPQLPPKAFAWNSLSISPYLPERALSHPACGWSTAWVAHFSQVVWAVRDTYVGNTFFDASASAFILPSLSVLSKSGEGPTAPNGPLSAAHWSETGSHEPQTQTSDNFDRQGLPTVQPAKPALPFRPDPEHDTPKRAFLQPPSDLGTSGKLDACFHDTGAVAETPTCTGTKEWEKAVCGAGLGPEWVKTLGIPGREKDPGAKY